jgi:hypothetical protein
MARDSLDLDRRGEPVALLRDRFNVGALAVQVAERTPNLPDRLVEIGLRYDGAWPQQRMERVLGDQRVGMLDQ